jgi:DNA-binding NtrC family response regulator
VIFTRPKIKTWGDTKSIVVIDDSLDFAKIVEGSLKKSGFGGHIHGYPFARAFYENVTTFPDLIVCDLCMPGDNGLEVHQWLKDHDFQGEFILCTGNTSALEDYRFEQGDINIIIKPPVIPPFIEKIKSCLKA